MDFPKHLDLQKQLERALALDGAGEIDAALQCLDAIEPQIPDHGPAPWRWTRMMPICI